MTSHDATETITDGRARPARPRGTTRAAKRQRQQLIRSLVTSQPVGNQHELVDLLARHGIEVTQATISRDIAELGLVKVAHGGQHVYAFPADLAPAPPTANDERLRRVLSDYPVTLGRSGLTLLVISQAGTADAIAQAIDESTLDEQEGTLAGDNTILVLFADETRLRTWRARFEALLPALPVPGYER